MYVLYKVYQNQFCPVKFTPNKVTRHNAAFKRQGRSISLSIELIGPQQIHTLMVYKYFKVRGPATRPSFKDNANDAGIEFHFPLLPTSKVCSRGLCKAGPFSRVPGWLGVGVFVLPVCTQSWFQAVLYSIVHLSLDLHVRMLRSFVVST